MLPMTVDLLGLSAGALTFAGGLFVMQDSGDRCLAKMELQEIVGGQR